MPFEKRIQYASFIENKDHIEAGWDKTFGDRKTEIVFIGQDMDEVQIRKELDACLSTDEEIANDFLAGRISRPLARATYVSVGLGKDIIC